MKITDPLAQSFYVEAESGKSYGTPHDLASLYGKGRNDSDPRNVPTGYDEDETLGRPKDSITTIGKQDSNFGKDRLGVKRMKDTDNWFRVYINGDFVSPTYYTYSYNGSINEIVFVFSLTYPLDANDEIAITGKFQEL